MIDKYSLKKINIEEELSKNNLSITFFAARLLMFVAIVISFRLQAQ